MWNGRGTSVQVGVLWYVPLRQDYNVNMFSMPTDPNKVQRMITILMIEIVINCEIYTHPVN